MTENQIRQSVADHAMAYVGAQEGSAQHKEILAIYNAYEPLPRGYALKDTDPWCAGFTSAIAIACGLSDIIPIECSCSRLIGLAKEMGIWVEDDDYVPDVGDLVLYDWQDDGKGDNTGAPDHVGFVAGVHAGEITAVVEGNKNNAVGVREVPLGGKYLRGYITPDYASRATEAKPAASGDTYTLTLNILRKGDKGGQVKALQRLLLSHGYKMTANGKTYGIDGDFGEATEASVRKVQSDCGWQVDGEAGPETMGGLLGLE